MAQSRLAQAGARVLASFVRLSQSAQLLSDHALTLGVCVEVIKADATRDTGIDALVEKVQAAFSPLHAVVFAAATGVHKPVAEMTGRHFDFTFSLNTRASLEIVNRLAPCMSAGSTIVALSSEGASRGIPTYSLVGASKAALESLVRNFAVEFAPRGVTVNCLSPGSVLTDAWRALPDADERLKAATAQSPRGRLTDLGEVADTALFLCSSAARGISGQVLVVDGGARIAGR